jgi:hypothetical protein
VHQPENINVIAMMHGSNKDKFNGVVYKPSYILQDQHKAHEFQELNNAFSLYIIFVSC